MGGGRLFNVKLNLIDPCSTVRASRTVEGCQAGGLGHQFQYRREYNAESPQQGSRRFNSIVKTKYIVDLGIVYLFLQQRTYCKSLGVGGYNSGYTVKVKE